jgi:hypothetical protein
MNEVLNIQEAITNLKTSIRDADHDFDEFMMTGDVSVRKDRRLANKFDFSFFLIPGLSQTLIQVKERHPSRVKLVHGWD